MSDSLTKQLEDTLRQCLEIVYNEVAISPAMLASCAINKLDSDNVSPILVQWGCNLELRQMARAMLRREFDPLIDKNDDHQPELFTGLQAKYPCKRNGENVYVDRMRLTKEERLFNIERMSREIDAKTQHRDALQAETDELDVNGFFAEVG